MLYLKLFLNCIYHAISIDIKNDIIDLQSLETKKKIKWECLKVKNDRVYIKF